MTAKSVASRRARVASLLEEREISSQAELAQTMAAEGYDVSQTTISRDLSFLGAARIRGQNQQLIYVLPHRQAQIPSTMWDQLAKLCQEVLLSAEASANLVVIKTPPGAAQYFASAVDRVGWEALLGTIAGDDTLMMICRDPNGGQPVADVFNEMTSSGQVPDEIVRDLM